MNGLQDLIAKLQKIEEADVANAAPAPVANAAPAPVANAAAPAGGAETMDQAIDRREKSAAAKQILQTMIKKKGDLGQVNGYFIEAGSGALLFSHPTKLAQEPNGVVATSKDLGFGEGKAFADKLTGLGLKITPETVTNPGIFGWKWTESTKTVLKINLKDLETVAAGKPPTQAPPPAVVTTNTASVAQPVVATTGDAGVVNNASSAMYQPNNGQAQQQAAAPADDKVAKIKQLTDLLTKFPTLKESVLFKSRIGRTLLESFDLGISEADVSGVAPDPTLAQTNANVVSAITQMSKADATKQIQDLITYFKDPKFNTDAEVQALITKAIATINGGTAGTAPVASDTSGAALAAVATATPEKPVVQPAPAPAVAALAKDNNIADPNKIVPGQKIKLPDGTEYTVAKGDNLTNILAGKYKGTAPGKVAPAGSVVPKPPANSQKIAPAGDPAKRLTVKPVLNSRAGTTRNGNKIYTLGDGTTAYWDATTKSYVPYDINKKKETGKPIPVTSFKLTPPPKKTASLGGAIDSTLGQQTDAMGGAYGESVGFGNDDLSRIVSLVHHR